MAKQKLCVLVIILTQILLIVFWVSQQGSLYWDVYYTLQRTHYFSDTTVDNHYIVYDPEYSLNQWLEASYVNDILVVDRENSILAEFSLPEIVVMTVKQPYWSLLNILEAILSSGVFSRWPGVILNLIFFVVSQVVLYLIVYRLSHDDRCALLSILLYGFGGMALSMATYVRFYVFSTLLCLLFTYIHIRIWEIPIKRWYFKLLLQMLSLIFAIWSIQTSQLTLFFFAGFMALYCLALLLNHRFAECLMYFLPMLIGGAYYLTTQTIYLYLLAHIREAFYSSSSSGPTLWVLSSIMTLTPFSFVNRAAHMFLCIGRFAYGYWPMFLLCIILLGIVIWNKRKETFQILTPIGWVVFGSLVLFMVIASALSFYAETRYSSYVFPLIAWFTAVVLLEFKELYPKAGVVLTGLFVGIIMFSTISGQRVDFVFSEDRDDLQLIREAEIPYAVVMQQETFNLNTEIMYATSVLLDDDSRILPVQNIYTAAGLLPDEFLLAVNRGNDMSYQVYGLGYTPDWVAETFAYRYYYMTR